MAKKAPAASGTPNNNEYYTGLRSLYDQAQSELNIRITHSQLGFDAMDRLYRTSIQKENWPFASKVAIPIAWTALVKKDTRLIASKLAGKLIPTDEGEELGAMVGTELLHAQWDDVDFFEDEPMLMRWFRISQNARKYGAGFAYIPWKTEKGFDGPTCIPWDNREVFTVAGSLNVDDGVFLGSWPTIDTLYKTSDQTGETGMYAQSTIKRLETLVGDSSQNVSVNRAILGLPSIETDQSLGIDPRYKRVHLVQYRSPDRWVDFVPSKGGEGDEPMLILRDIPNPYGHGRVPVVKLNYYPIDDDQYGVSELESIRSMMKALWALICNYLDDVNISLFPIIKGHPTNVNWSTVEYKARATWIMQNPETDLVRLESSNSNLQKVTEIYKLLVGAMAEALGESSGEVSSQQIGSPDKTATEIKDTALLRSARDNFNKLALSAAMAKMTWFWWQMDRQFLTEQKVVRVVGKEAIEYFVGEGLDQFTLSEQGWELVEKNMRDHMGITPGESYNQLLELGKLEPYAEPLYGVKGGEQGAQLPKLTLDRSGKTGFLRISPGDMEGNYRYIPDIEALSMPNDQEDAQNILGIIDRMANPQILQMLQAQGDMPQMKEMLVKAMAKLKINDGDRFFGSGEGMGTTPMQGQQDPNQPVQPGQPTPPQGGTADLMAAMGQPGAQPPAQPQLQPALAGA
jgi:hypothetical protein